MSVKNSGCGPTVEKEHGPVSAVFTRAGTEVGVRSRQSGSCFGSAGTRERQSVRRLPCGDIAEADVALPRQIAEARRGAIAGV